MKKRKGILWNYSARNNFSNSTIAEVKEETIKSDGTVSID